jgi:hypothetical protein
MTKQNNWRLQRKKKDQSDTQENVWRTVWPTVFDVAKSSSKMQCLMNPKQYMVAIDLTESGFICIINTEGIS